MIIFYLSGGLVLLSVVLAVLRIIKKIKLSWWIIPLPAVLVIAVWIYMFIRLANARWF